MPPVAICAYWVGSSARVGRLQASAARTTVRSGPIKGAGGPGEHHWSGTCGQSRDQLQRNAQLLSISQDLRSTASICCALETLMPDEKHAHFQERINAATCKSITQKCCFLQICRSSLWLPDGRPNLRPQLAAQVVATRLALEEAFTVVNRCKAHRHCYGCRCTYVRGHSRRAEQHVRTRRCGDLAYWQQSVGPLRTP